MRSTFWLDDVRARDVGIQLQRPVSFSAREPNIKTFSVAGRNGTLTEWDGTYKNMTGTAECFVIGNPVSRNVSYVRRFLAGQGYKRLIVSQDMDHFVLARVMNHPAVDDRMRRLNPFTIKFDCKPQFFLVDGEEPISVTVSGLVLDNVYAGAAKPLVTVYGTGNGVLGIGDYEVSLAGIDGYITLDCETQNAHKDGIRANDKVSAIQFPVLDLGESEIQFTGDITGVTIIPRWWD